MTDLPIQPADDPEPPEPQPEPQPQPPSIDEAYRIIAEQEGWDPRLTRFEMQEMKRRRDDLERRERELQERQRQIEPQAPAMEFSMPELGYLDRKIDRVASLLEKREQIERDREEQALLTERQTYELRRAYENVMRQNGVADDRQIESQSQAFFSAMAEIYPDGIPEQLGPEGAARNTFRLWKGSYASQPPKPGPRAQYVIPSGNSGAPMVQGDDAGPRRSNESQEDYVARLKRVLAGATFKDLPERVVINPPG